MAGAPAGPGLPGPFAASSRLDRSWTVRESASFCFAMPWNCRSSSWFICSILRSRAASCSGESSRGKRRRGRARASEAPPHATSAAMSTTCRPLGSVGPVPIASFHPRILQRSPSRMSVFPTPVFWGTGADCEGIDGREGGLPEDGLPGECPVRRNLWLLQGFGAVGVQSSTAAVFPSRICSTDLTSFSMANGLRM